MSLPQSTRKLCQFFEDKKHLRERIEKISAGAILPLSEVELLLSLEEKLKAYPSFSRGLHTNLSELKTLVKNIPHSEEKTPETIPPQQNYNTVPPALTFPSETALTKTAFKTATQKKILFIAQSLEKEISSFPPPPQLIHDFYEAQGIVGEEKNRELLLYGALAKANLGIESLAGSGKSALLYALLQAFPKESYKIIHQATGKSLFNNPERNNVKFWVIPELQKIFTQDIEDLLKNLTEGVSATYTRTNARRDGVDSFEIKKKAVIYSFAITNKHLKERDDEFYRRFIILHTDISRQQNQEVAKKFAERDFTEKKGEKIDNSLPQRIAVALEFNGEVKNPFLPYIVESLPSEISGQMRFRSSVKYLHSLVAGCTLFYSPHLQEGRKMLFSTLEDTKRVLALYEEVLVDNLYGLSVVDRALLNLTSESPKTKNEILMAFQENYGEVARVFHQSLDRLVAVGLVNREEDYHSRKNLSLPTFESEKAISAADSLMKAHYPLQRDEWYEQNVKQMGSSNSLTGGK